MRSLITDGAGSSHCSYIQAIVSRNDFIPAVCMIKLIRNDK